MRILFANTISRFKDSENLSQVRFHDGFFFWKTFFVLCMVFDTEIITSISIANVGVRDLWVKSTN